MDGRIITRTGLPCPSFFRNEIQHELRGSSPGQCHHGEQVGLGDPRPHGRDAHPLRRPPRVPHRFRPPHSGLDGRVRPGSRGPRHRGDHRRGRRRRAPAGHGGRPHPGAGAGRPDPEPGPQRRRLPPLDRPDALRRAGRDAGHRQGGRHERRPAGRPHPGQHPSRPAGEAPALRRRPDPPGPGRDGALKESSGASGVIAPGSVVGVLGSGQLGRMFAIAARRMGYRVHTLSPDYDTPTGQVADREVQAAYDDLDAVREFARGVDVVTFEFENVAASATEAAAEHAPVRPAGSVLHTTQNRLREKAFLVAGGFPVTPFAPVRSLDELSAALAALGAPAVLKTAGWGYDGKGQVKIAAVEEAATAWEAVGRQESVLEAFVDFEREVSVVAARGLDGSFAHFGVVENRHSRHILDVSIAPAAVSPRVAQDAVEIAQGILEGLSVVGVLCVEMFLTRAGRLLVNELAPRPHNSGHLTFDATVTSQFEQQLRAITGLALGSTELLRPAAMANLLGDLWQHGEPDWAAACRHPDVKLHLYGKAEPRPGRKMGHLTAMGRTVDEAMDRVVSARDALLI